MAKQRSRFNLPCCPQCVLLGSDGDNDFYFCTRRNQLRAVSGPAVAVECTPDAAVELLRAGQHLDLKVRCLNQAVAQDLVTEKIKVMVAQEQKTG